jgi:16S rRNA (uracil1498-N3)-methyltransferase
MRRIRLYLEAPLAPGAQVTLDADQTRRLQAVLRLQPGDPVRVFNGDQGEYAGVLALRGRRDLCVQLEDCVRAPSPRAGPVLLFAPLKRQATDWIVEKAVELGVSRIIPVITRRTVAETVRLDRWRLIAMDAAAQCERLDLPVFDAPTALDRALIAWPPARALLYADETGGPAMPAALQGYRGAPPGLLIGPEGGFEPVERDWVRSLDFVRPFSFGSLILRAETACIAGLAQMSAWGQSAQWGMRTDETHGS